MINLLCKLGIHKYRAKHKYLGATPITYDLGGGKTLESYFETVEIGASKCERCQKPRPAPKLKLQP